MPSQEFKYYIFHCVKHSEAFFRQSPEEEAASQKLINEFILSWSPRVVQYLGGHAKGLCEWDWIGVFGVQELSDWQAFREEYSRRFFGRIEKAQSMPAVSHTEFRRATADIPHYLELRSLGAFPGGGEARPS